jgi:cytochrome P450
LLLLLTGPLTSDSTDNRRDQVGFTRTIMKPFRFKDGTLIPPGTSLTAPIYAIQRDPDRFANPDIFDGLRFAHNMDKRNHMVATSVQHALFSHGRHAW